MERSTKIAMGIGVGMFLLVGCCVGMVFLPFIGCSREFVRQPDVNIVVAGTEGPVAGALVEQVWWSDPHGVVHSTTTHTTSPDGRIVLRKQHEEERIMPLCMHGVPFHQHQFCFDAEGYKPVGLLVRDHEQSVSGEIILEPGEGTCTGQVGYGSALPTTSVSNADVFTIR